MRSDCVPKIALNPGMSRLLSVCAGLLCVATKSGPEYKLQEKILVEVGNVGPFRNPEETYKFDSLPFCAPEYA